MAESASTTTSSESSSSATQAVQTQAQQAFGTLTYEQANSLLQNQGGEAGLLKIGVDPIQVDIIKQIAANPDYRPPGTEQVTTTKDRETEQAKTITEEVKKAAEPFRNYEEEERLSDAEQSKTTQREGIAGTIERAGGLANAINSGLVTPEQAISLGYGKADVDKAESFVRSHRLIEGRWYRVEDLENQRRIVEKQETALRNIQLAGGPEKGLKEGTLSRQTLKEGGYDPQEVESLSEGLSRIQEVRTPETPRPSKSDTVKEVLKETGLSLIPVYGTVRGAKQLKEDWDKLNTFERTTGVVLTTLSAVGDVTLIGGVAIKGLGAVPKVGKAFKAVRTVTVSSGDEAAKLSRLGNQFGRAPQTYTIATKNESNIAELARAIPAYTGAARDVPTVRILTLPTEDGVSTFTRLSRVVAENAPPTAKIRPLVLVDRPLSTQEAVDLASALRKVGKPVLLQAELVPGSDEKAILRSANTVKNLLENYKVKVEPQTVLSGTKLTKPSAISRLESAELRLLRNEVIQLEKQLAEAPTPQLRSAIAERLAVVRRDYGRAVARYSELQVKQTEPTKPKDFAKEARKAQLEEEKAIREIRLEDPPRSGGGVAVQTRVGPSTHSELYSGVKYQPTYAEALVAKSAVYRSFVPKGQPGTHQDVSLTSLNPPKPQEVPGIRERTAPDVTPRKRTQPEPDTRIIEQPKVSPQRVRKVSPLSEPEIRRGEEKKPRTDSDKRTSTEPSVQSRISDETRPREDTETRPKTETKTEIETKTKVKSKTKTKTKAVERVLVFPRTKEEGIKSSKLSSLPSFTWTQGELFVGIRPPYSESNVSYTKGPLSGAKRVKGPREAWRDIHKNTRGVGPNPNSYDEFASWFSAQPE